MDTERSAGRRLRPVIIAFAVAVAMQSPVGSVARAAEIDATVINDAGRPVQDAVIVALPIDGAAPLPPHPPAQIVDQVDKEFVPRVKAVVVGTPVLFPNHDNIRHQVYSFSPAKRFELPLYAGVPAKPILFDKPGLVVLGCNIHDWMVGYIYVSESPWFGVTGTTGEARIADLPPGTYSLRVWHPELVGTEEATRQILNVTSRRQNPVHWTLTLRPEIRIRRAPSAGHERPY